MSWLIRTGTACLLAVFLLPNVAYSLSFKVIDDGLGGRVLLIYDCGRLKDARVCTPENSRFHASDPRTLADNWNKGPFDEVWLLSGGGDLVAGIALANDFRAHAQAVRVPSSSRLVRAGEQPMRPPACVSSCTVAFMGGQFRAIDDGATYQVHASSRVSWYDVKASRPAIDATLGLIKELGLRARLNYFNDDSRQSARQLFTLFQDTLWLAIKPRNPQDPLGLRDPERQRREQAFNDWERERQGTGSPYSSEQQARDEAMLTLEGEAALQDIIMREERQDMSRAIRDIRGLVPRLGRRADAALAMLAAMYDTSSILESNSMPRETLLKMGYLTEFVK